ncbi:unnamed protein product [Discosporangium mesarthrocarpum]
MIRRHMIRVCSSHASHRVMNSSSIMLSTTAGVTLDGSSVNSKVVEAKYAVRGNVLNHAAKLEKKLADGEDLPFEKVVACNIGNPHALLQAPLSFHREVLSLCLSPWLIETHPNLFGEDVVERASMYLKSLRGGVGAYTSSQGVPAVREEIAAFIEERDGHPAYPDRIFLTNGASEGVRFILSCLLRGAGYKDGLLTPIPQYPLYSATLTLLGGTLVPYHLDERADWGVKMENLKASLEEARAEGTTVRGLVVINPGNPTGNLLAEDQMRDVIQLAVDEKLVLMADEVYQSNIWKKNTTFVSFKKVACDMGYFGNDGDECFQLASFHSTSKGYLGECGLRGGYMEVHGIGPEVRSQLLKLCSVVLCSNSVGQLVTGMMVNPPKKGQPSYESFAKERDDILSSMERRSHMVHSCLNRMEGVTCNAAAGAMYAFPRITLPMKAREAAAEEGVPPDEFYCLRVLEQSGIILVPGSGFGQEEGTWHYRTTFLPSEETMEETMAILGKAHSAFLEKYKD